MPSDSALGPHWSYLAQVVSGVLAYGVPKRQCLPIPGFQCPPLLLSSPLTFPLPTPQPCSASPSDTASHPPQSQHTGHTGSRLRSPNSSLAVYEVKDALGASSPFGIINFEIAAVPDRSAALPRTLEVLDGFSRDFSWVADGFVRDADGVFDPVNGIEKITITQLPAIPGDLRVAAESVISYAPSSRVGTCDPAAAADCYPYEVQVTSFTYRTELNSTTAIAGEDSFQFQVTDLNAAAAANAGESDTATVSLLVTRQGDNNAAPSATPGQATATVEGGTQTAVLRGTDEQLTPELLLYEISSAPLYGSIEVVCPEPLSWAEQDKPYVVVPPEDCPTRFGERNYLKCDPACAESELGCQDEDCVQALGVLDGTGVGNYVQDPEKDPATDPNPELRMPLLRYRAPGNFFGSETVTFRACDQFNCSDNATIECECHGRLTCVTCISRPYRSLSPSPSPSSSSSFPSRILPLQPPAVPVSNDPTKPDLPVGICSPEASTNTSLMLGLEDTALSMRDGPVRNWHHGDEDVDVRPCGSEDSVADEPGIRTCYLEQEPGFTDVSDDDLTAWSAFISADIRANLVADGAEPPQGETRDRLGE